MFTGEEDEPFSLNIQTYVCWGFLKSLTDKREEEVTVYDQYLDDKENDRYFCAEDWDTCFIENEGKYCGIPTDKTPQYLRVYIGDALGGEYLGIKDLYERVLSCIPVWFKDFSLMHDEENGEDYLLVSLKTSSIRNYNALRMIRTLLTIVKSEVGSLPPIEILILSELFNLSDFELPRFDYSSDERCLPIPSLGTYDKVFQAIENGPITSYEEQALGSIDRFPFSDTKFRNRFMNRAFINEEDYEAKESILIEGERTESFDKVVLRLRERRVA